MRLFIKQKVFSWNAQFTVKNEQGEDCYRVEGEFFSWGHKLHVYTMDGLEVAFIQQKLMSWMPRYIIYINGQEVAQLVKEFTFFSPRYQLEGTPWELEGDFWAHEYQLVDRGQSVMQMSKEWFTWGDSYVLDIAQPHNALLCLCVALSVDCVLASQSSAAHSHHHGG